MPAKKIPLSELPINPFEDNVVFEPREAERSVRGLNDKPLERLRRQFARLERDDFPRVRPAFLKAQLVTSAEPGYGKSHLIGRLFRNLEGRSTQIYVRPFQDASASWRSILLRVVQELNRADASAEDEFQGPTQLDVFAHGVIGRLLAILMKKKLVVVEEGDSLAMARRLSDKPLHAFEFPEGWLPHFSPQEFEQIMPLCVAELEESGVVFHTPPETWLQVLFAYTRAKRHTAARTACLDWLKGESLFEEDAARIGLSSRAGAESLPLAEESAARRNEAAMHRVQDFCALAGFYRPFLFCFDQTELFTSDPALMIEFGAVVDRLVSHGLNLMVVVTANLEPWTRLIKRNLQTALHDRFSDPIELEGMNELQAAALARQRLGRWNVDEMEIERFCDQVWLAETFAEKKTCSVRAFLRRSATRCDELIENRPEVAPEQTLEDYFRHYQREVTAKSALMEFDPDILRWLIGPAALDEALKGVRAEKHIDAKRYFPIRWEAPGQREVLFGFEDSAHWKRWEAILRYSATHAEQARAQNRVATIIFLRTCEQQPVPNPAWKMLGAQFEAASEHLRVHVLGLSLMTRLYAAYELYANVIEGNAPFPREAALEFIRGQLRPWWEELLAGRKQPPGSAADAAVAMVAEPAPELVEDVRRIVRRRSSLTLDQLAEDLGGKQSPEMILAACHRVPEITAIATAHAMAIKWEAED